MSDTAHERSVKARAVAIAEARKVISMAAEQAGSRTAQKRYAVLNTQLDVIEKTSTECEETLREYVDSYRSECAHRKALDKYTDELLAILTRALADRDALLARLGLTDAQWSAQGGACEAGFTPADKPSEEG